MHVELQRAYREAHKVFETVASLQVTVAPYIAGLQDKHAAADAAYACKKIEELADEIRKRARELKETAMQIACTIAVLSDDMDTIKTDYVSATPDVRIIATLPTRKKDPEKFTALMQYLKIPDELWDGKEHSAVEMHWPGVVELVNKMLAEGRPAPPGIDTSKTYSEYKLILRGKQEPDVPPNDDAIPF